MQNNIQVIFDKENGKVGLVTDKTPFDKVSFRLLLNITLAAQFKLQPLVASEGGIAGQNAQLKNSRTYILGLEKDPDIQRRPTEQEMLILEWYHQLLTTLFITGVVGQTMPHLLWFDEKFTDEGATRYKYFLSVLSLTKWSFKKTTLNQRINFIYLELPRTVIMFKESLIFPEFLPFAERERMVSS